MSGKVASYLVTGASSGLGLEFVKQLAARKSGSGGDNIHVFATCRKKTSSATKIDHISSVQPAEGNLITILEDIDVTKDECKEILIEKLSNANCSKIDVVIHNAGGMGNTSTESQSLENVTSELMLNTVNLNGIGPLRVQQALLSKGYMGVEGGKVVVITSGMGSIGDNDSGGMYAYRSSKALVNMIAKGMSCDLKSKGIAVMSINPSFVATEFGGFGPDKIKGMGGMTPEKSIKQMIQAIDELSLETTGRYMTVDKDGDVPIEYAAGW
jgi:NAD(P)-dependent dehydrogenase (short-subunit alcohol dehydrogenase family)